MKTVRDTTKGSRMIVKPKIRGFICTTAHPAGCAKSIQNQIDYVKSQGSIANGPKKVLVIGASTGYGLASRIVSAFGCKAATVGVFYEKEAEGRRTATAGWYNTVAFDQAAKAEGLYTKSINGDAYSNEIKQEVMKAIKEGLGQVDLVIYSLAAPRRENPKTGKVSKSVLRPIGAPYTNKSIDFAKDEIISVSLPTATQEEIDQTIDVMGGDDWQMWIEALEQADLLAEGAMTVAYSYVGPEVTRPVYRNGTIGAAKEHLEVTAQKLNDLLKRINGQALISVNKALVTQSSSAIPFIPLYFIILMKIMKEKGIHENCIEQIYRLYSSCLFTGGPVPVDSAGLVRIDDFEMRDDVQAEVVKNWKTIGNENVKKIADVEGYHRDFLELFGFGLDGVDYEADVDIDLKLP